ncbi:MAG: HIT domain-containing protein [Proteobacteria bacterium]|nr:HIT domain-containing protein [Pseudomonadota bacterium]MBU1594616.1 HIT domain-containing protein [Pseudomonadota bacterium]
MEVLWAPWRLDYILGPKPDECVFCVPNHTGEDAERYILCRGRHNYVIMNRYPYNNAHLMVTPYRHVSCLTDLTPEEAHENMDLLRSCVGILQKVFRPHGINAGLNLGEAAGSGIAAHIHFQIVPRWNGDASFMAVFSETRVMPEHLRSTYNRLKPHFDALA